MKTYLFVIFSLCLSICACVQAPKSDAAKVSDAKAVDNTSQAGRTLNIDNSKSLITWVGTKPTGRHNGTLNIKSGGLGITNSQIVSGNFDIEMSTLKVKDMDEENNNNLAGHLMSEDFFKVKQFPISTFIVTSVVPYRENAGETKPLLDGVTHNVIGNLTMLGNTKSISFPAKITFRDGGVKAEANFNINRTDWGISYNSDKSLGDKFIRHDVNIGLNIVAM